MMGVISTFGKSSSQSRKFKALGPPTSPLSVGSDGSGLWFVAPSSLSTFLSQDNAGNSPKKCPDTTHTSKLFDSFYRLLPFA